MKTKFRRPIASVQDEITRTREEVRKSSTIYAPHGSCVIFGRCFFEKGGTLDFPAFLFAEEMFVAEQIRLMGGQVLYAPNMVVVHNEHVSTGPLPYTLLASYQQQSYEYLWSQFFSNPPSGATGL